MKPRYRWTLYKTLEFLNSRRPDLEIRASFFHQLTSLEARLERQGLGPKSNTWNEIGDDPSNLASEELLLTNTFLNSRNAPIAEYTAEMLMKGEYFSLRFHKSILFCYSRFEDEIGVE